MSIRRSPRKTSPSALHQTVLTRTPIVTAAADRISTFPRFPPLGLVRRLPSNLTGYGMLSADGQTSDNP
jgi:hypothetical protein